MPVTRSQAKTAIRPSPMGGPQIERRNGRRNPPKQRSQVQPWYQVRADTHNIISGNIEGGIRDAKAKISFMCFHWDCDHESDTVQKWVLHLRRQHRPPIPSQTRHIPCQWPGCHEPRSNVAHYRSHLGLRVYCLSCGESVEEEFSKHAKNSANQVLHEGCQYWIADPIPALRNPPIAPVVPPPPAPIPIGDVELPPRSRLKLLRRERLSLPGT